MALEYPEDDSLKREIGRYFVFLDIGTTGWARYWVMPLLTDPIGELKK